MHLGRWRCIHSSEMQRIAHTPVKFPVSFQSPMAAWSSTSTCTRWWHLNSRVVVIALERVPILSIAGVWFRWFNCSSHPLVSLFLSLSLSFSLSPFFSPERERKRERERETLPSPSSCRSLVPLHACTSFFSSLHSFTYISWPASWVAFVGTPYRPENFDDFLPPRRSRSDISSCGAMELFNPQFLVRFATRDICFRYLNHGTFRGWFCGRRLETKKSDSYKILL